MIPGLREYVKSLGWVKSPYCEEYFNEPNHYYRVIRGARFNDIHPETGSTTRRDGSHTTIKSIQEFIDFSPLFRAKGKQLKVKI